MVRSVEVIFDSGEGGWSTAHVDWAGRRVLGIRWNGDANSAIGNPQSHAQPTWFLVPPELELVILQWIEEHVNSRPGGLLDQYREMALDAGREKEAQQWCEGLVGDVPAQGWRKEMRAKGFEES
jgi:hypothetical protein